MSESKVVMVTDTYSNISNDSDIDRLSRLLRIPKIDRDTLRTLTDHTVLTFNHECMNSNYSDSNYYINFNHSLMGPTKVNMLNESSTKPRNLFIYPEEYRYLLNRCESRIFTTHYYKLLRLLGKSEDYSSPLITTHYTINKEELRILINESIRITRGVPRLRVHPLLHTSGTKYYSNTLTDVLSDEHMEYLDDDSSYSTRILFTDGMTNTIMEYLYYHCIHKTGEIDIYVLKDYNLKMGIQDPNNLGLFNKLVSRCNKVEMDYLIHYKIVTDDVPISIDASNFIGGLVDEYKRFINTQ